MNAVNVNKSMFLFPFAIDCFLLILKMDWQKLEAVIGEKVPNCLKQFLSVCAYDSISSIQNINSESIREIESHMNTCLESVQQLDCCHSNAYKSQTAFKLLPGHKDFLLSMSTYKHANSEQRSKFPVLNAMIRNSFQNATCHKNHATYDDFMRYFATYVFLTAGRSCYEFLRANLGLPSTKTVCKLKL